MRVIVVVLLVMCLVVSGFAAGDGGKDSGEGDCVAVTHAHQYSDMRMAMVEITDTSPCGFSFANLEENTVGVSNSFQFARDFEVIRVAQKDKNSASFFKFELSKRAVKKGMCGIVTYCYVCKIVFIMRPVQRRNDNNTMDNP